MLEVNGIFADYGGRRVLRGVDMRFEDGMLTGIVGPNGCGKTTLLRVAGGSFRRFEGMVTADGENVYGISPKLRARRVARLFQDRIIPDMTAEELARQGRYPYLAFGRVLSDMDREIAALALERCGAAQFAERKLSELSGGERQRAFMAMLVAQETQNMLLDEPAAHLDPGAVYDIMAILRSLAGEGRAVAAVIHDVAAALDFCDVIYVMDGGKVVYGGDREGAAEHIERAFGITVRRETEGYYIAPKKWYSKL